MLPLRVAVAPALARLDDGIPASVIGPLMVTAPEVVICERRLSGRRWHAEVMLIVVPPEDVVPGSRLRVVALPLAPAAG